jgi:hypothetical protein
MKHKQYYVSEAEPLNFVVILSTDSLAVVLPDYKKVSKRDYRKLQWGERKLRILARSDRLKAKASKIKKALRE